MEYVWLVLLGLGVGTLGTLIGVGGGFVLMPVLLLVWPDRDPASLTAVSLAVVFFNAASGSYSYARMRRIDYRSGLLFLITGIPGAMLGAYLVNFVPRTTFNFVFSLLLVAGAAYIFFRGVGRSGQSPGPRDTFQRDFVDAHGVHHRYAFSLARGMSLSILVGMASSLLGIGGGIIHVPAMVSLLHFPVHIATATSQFILGVMSLTGTVVHLCDGSLGPDSAALVAALAGGAVIGAQLGAKLSKRMHGRWIMRVLAVALALVGLRILVLAVMTALQAE